MIGTAAGRPMTTEFRPRNRFWRHKFLDALRGIRLGVKGQSSFVVHLAFSFTVIGIAAVLRVSLVEWCLLILCITSVLTAEMFNSSLESLAKAVDVQHNLHLKSALDIGSAAVLISAVGAAVVGLLIFIHRLGEMFAWWAPSR
jgi:diacylglycerol kinase